MQENVVTENKLSGISGNIFKPDKSGTQVNNNDTVFTDNGPINTHVLSSGDKSEYITVITYCKPSDQFLLPVMLFKDVNKGRIWVMVYS